jgi:HEAT repeat protein
VLYRLVARVGFPAAGALLDALELEDDRTARWRLFEMLAQLGSEVGNAVVVRLPGAPRYVQRNLLLLMARLETWPKDFSALPYAKHPDPRVRREAYALLLRDPTTRAESIALAVSDTDERIVRAALNAALEGGCPREAVGVLTERLDQRSLDGMMAVLAIRVIAPVRLPVVLDVLVKSALSRKRTWFFGRKLAPRSQPMLAALSALAWTWAQEPQAMKVLSLAERDPDSAVQNAIRSRGP